MNTVQTNAHLRIFEMSMSFSRCRCCGRQFVKDSEIYCSYKCESIASITKKKFYSKKDLR